MKKPISDELATVIGEMAKAVGGDGPFHVLTPRICDRCKDEGKEAFPYGSIMTTGKYNDLCNDCFEILEKEGEAHAQTYSLDTDGIDVRLPLPFSESEESALDAFLALSPCERMGVLVRLDAAEFLAGLNESIRRLAEWMRRGPAPTAGSGIAELDEIINKTIDNTLESDADILNQAIDEIFEAERMRRGPGSEK